MTMRAITVMGYVCERCSYQWIPKNPDVRPRVCPRCKSAWWDVPLSPEQQQRRAERKAEKTV